MSETVFGKKQVLKNDLPIGVTDSGVGGLTVLAELERIMPNERFVFLADRSGAPYGTRSDSYILGRAFACVQVLQERGIKALVIACNTATAVAAIRLRECLSMPVIGIEPAIRVASRETKGSIIVFTTVATARQNKFLSLVEACGAERITVQPLPNLACEIEKNFADKDWLESCSRQLIKYAGGYKAIVLGCTHYVFLKPYLEALKTEDMTVFDGNGGTALYTKKVLCQKGLAANRQDNTEIKNATEFIYI